MEKYIEWMTQCKINKMILTDKGGEQSERTPAKSAVKSPPMAGWTCGFACKAVLCGTFDWWLNRSHPASKFGGCSNTQ